MGCHGQQGESRREALLGLLVAAVREMKESRRSRGVMRLGLGDDASSPTRRRPDLDRTPSQMSFLPPTCEGSALLCWTSQGFSSEGREVTEGVST